MRSSHSITRSFFIVEGNSIPMQMGSPVSKECNCYSGREINTLPCGGCAYCTRCHSRWSRFEADVDDVVPMAIQHVSELADPLDMQNLLPELTEILSTLSGELRPATKGSRSATSHFFVERYSTPTSRTLQTKSRHKTPLELQESTEVPYRCP